MLARAVYVDEFYLKTMGISLIDGRDFRNIKVRPVRQGLDKIKTRGAQAYSSPRVLLKYGPSSPGVSETRPGIDIHKVIYQVGLS